MATFKAVVLKSKNDVKEDGTTNIKIRITHNRKINYVSTDLFIVPTDMNNKTGQVVSGKNISYLNLSITSWLHKCRTIDVALGDTKNLMTVSAIKQKILDVDAQPLGIDFFKYTELLIQSTKTNQTAENYHSCAHRLKSFVGTELPFSYINTKFLNSFEAFLYRQGVKNGVVNYMVTFRAIFNKARDYYNNEDIGDIPIPHYPFRRYKMPVRVLKTNEHVLTIFEYKALFNYNPKTAGEEIAKDMFFLMFYLIGIESKDLFFLPKPIKGRVAYVRFKTGRKYSIKIEPEAQVIIDKYAGRDTLLNFIDRFQKPTSFLRYINNHLSGSKCKHITGILPRIKLPKRATTKWARHTWATFARNDCRISKDDVALCLGHQDLDNKVTDIYIKYDYSIIDECNRNVISFIKAESV